MDAPSELPLDAPDADVAEQARDVAATPEAEQPSEVVIAPSTEADEYDAADQSRVVELDEDEYR